jgi:hypothetical protein
MTAIQSLAGRLETVTLFPTAVITATGAGSTKVDLAGFEGHAFAILNQAAGCSGVTRSVKLRHCDTVDGEFVDLPDGAFTGNTANTAQAEVLQFNTNDCKRFVEAYFTVAGGTGAGASALSIVGQKKYNH